MKRLIFILSFFAALFPFTAHAASTAPYVPLSVPTSPQAAAFKMYGDVAVNPAMGVPDISIPLFDIDHHGYRLPLSLNTIRLRSIPATTMTCSAVAGHYLSAVAYREA